MIQEGMEDSWGSSMWELDEVRDLLRKLQPVIGRRTRRLWSLYLLSADRMSQQEHLDLLRVMADQHVYADYCRRVLLPPPLSEALKGKYALGTVMYPEGNFAKLGLRDKEMAKHILIVGMTGAGKTNLSFQLLRELARNGVPFLVFDWKRSYRGLKALEGFENLKFIDVGKGNSDFRFNPLIPPQGTDAKHWLGLLIDVMSHAFFYGHGVEYFLRQGIDELYSRFGNYEGKEDYPTFSDLRVLLQKTFVRGREMLWMSSVKRVLAALTEPSVLAETLNVRRGSGIESLLNNQVILEMDDLPALEKTFLVEAMLLWVYQFRKGGGRQGDFQHAIFIEEAHHVLSGAKEAKLGQETVIEGVVRMIREFGEGVVIVDQEPSKLSKSIIANTNCKICFNLGNGADVKIMSGAMGLELEEEKAIDQLKVGHAIVKLKDRFREPLHVRVPFVNLDLEMTRERGKTENPR